MNRDILLQTAIEIGQKFASKNIKTDESTLLRLAADELGCQSDFEKLSHTVHQNLCQRVREGK